MTSTARHRQESRRHRNFRCRSPWHAVEAGRRARRPPGPVRAAGPRRSGPRRRHQHGGDDLAVAGAAAEHAAQAHPSPPLRRAWDSARAARLRPSAGPACRCRIGPRHAPGTPPAGSTDCHRRGLRRCAPGVQPRRQPAPGRRKPAHRPRAPCRRRNRRRRSRPWCRSGAGRSRSSVASRAIGAVRSATSRPLTSKRSGTALMPPPSPAMESRPRVRPQRPASGRPAHAQRQAGIRPNHGRRRAGRVRRDKRARRRRRRGCRAGGR